jgi:hypothetical protein
MTTTFFSMVMKHFQYLIKDYGFVVKKVEETERAPEIEGRIEFESLTTFVIISGEQWAAGTSVGRIKDDRQRYFLNPAEIHEYLSLTEFDKKLLLSLDPKDNRKARIVSNQIRLLHNKKDSSSIIEDIDNQLSDYSKWLRQYAEPFLRGDFSQWLGIYEYKIARNRAAYIRSGKEEFVRVVGRSKDEKESIFQNSLDYLKSLREEYGKNNESLM